MRKHSFPWRAVLAFKLLSKLLLNQLLQHQQETHTFLKTPLDIAKFEIWTNKRIWNLIQDHIHEHKSSIAKEYTPSIGKEVISSLTENLKHIKSPQPDLHFLKPSFGSPCSSFPMGIIQHNLISYGLSPILYPLSCFYGQMTIGVTRLEQLGKVGRLPYRPQPPFN